MKDKEKKIVMIGIAILCIVIVLVIAIIIGSKALRSSKNNSNNSSNNSSVNNTVDNDDNNGVDSSSDNDTSNDNNNNNNSNGNSGNTNGNSGTSSNNATSKPFDEIDITYDVVWSSELLCDDVTINFANYQGQIDDLYDYDSYSISSVTSGSITVNSNCETAAITDLVINGKICKYDIETTEVSCK